MKKIDTNRDGLISYDEFQEHFRDVLTHGFDKGSWEVRGGRASGLGKARRVSPHARLRQGVVGGARGVEGFRVSKLPLTLAPCSLKP